MPLPSVFRRVAVAAGLSLALSSMGAVADAALAPVPVANTVSSTTLPPLEAAPDSTGVASTSTSGPLVTAVSQPDGGDGVAGSAVFVGVLAIIGAGVGFLVWSKRRKA
jgi:hypothetical protein